jgi:SPP1 family predicted phage head-tail adaptor
MAFDPLYLLAGDLRHKIVIQKPSTTRDDAGQPVSTWTTVLTTRAKIESTTSPAYKSLVQGDAISSQATDVFTLRWPGSSIDLAPGMRVQFGDNLYLVQAVDNILRRDRVVKLFTLAIDADTN